MTFQQLISKHPDKKEELEERAAIIQFMGGKSKQEAERVTVWIYQQKGVQ